MTGFDRVEGGCVGVTIPGPTGMLNFDANVVTGENLEGGQLVVVEILDDTAFESALTGFGATGGGIFAGGGIVRLSSLNGSGYPGEKVINNNKVG